MGSFIELQASISQFLYHLTETQALHAEFLESFKIHHQHLVCLHSSTDIFRQSY